MISSHTLKMSLWVVLAVSGWIWVIGWPFCVYALKIQNYTVEFETYDETTHRRFLRQSLKEVYIAQSLDHAPDTVYSVVAAQTYLVPQAALRPGMRIAPYHAHYKIPSTLMNATLFMVRATTNATTPNPPPSCSIKPWFQDRFLVNCTTHGAAVSMSNRVDVLWISHAPVIQTHSRRARDLLVPVTATPPSGLGTGLGVRMISSDTGLDPYHCSFYDPDGFVTLGYVSTTAHSKILGILNNPGYTDFYANDNAHGHSTAGVMLGNACFGETGVAPDAKLLFIDVSPAGVETILLPANFFDMLIHLHTTYGMNIHSASWGSLYGAGTYDDLCYLFDLMVYNYPHLTNVISAGNSGKPMAPPASAKNIISVGATSFDLSEQAYFSSTGLLADGRWGPLVTAPGWDVVTPRAFAEPDPDHADYSVRSGTSFSAPILAALCALFEEIYKLVNWSVPPTGALNAAMVMSHAVAPTKVVDDNGLIVTGAAITTYGTPVISADRLFSLDLIALEEAPGVVTRKSICVSVTDTEDEVMTPHVFTLTWADVPAALYAEKTLVNDIDMVILSDITVYWSEDGVNPHERIPGVVGSWYRVVLFPYGNVTTLGPVRVSLHATLRTSTSLVDESGPCGTCLPAEIEPCTDGLQYCLLSGAFSPCIVPSMSPSSVWSNDTNATCVSPHAIETHVHFNGSCLATACENGYYVQNDECKCVENSYIECGEAGSRSFSRCTADNEYGLCSDNSRFLVKSDATGEDRMIQHKVIMWVVMILLLTL